MKKQQKGRKKALTFLSFLKEKEQKQELVAMLGVYTLLCILLGIYAPYPYVFPDSGAYLLTAANGVANAWRPAGYSHFIQLVHLVSSSFTALYVASFMLNAVACLGLIFSVKYLIKIPSKLFFYSFAALAMLSPSLLFCTNFAMSDGLFCTLTTLWLTLGLWLIKRRTWWLIAAHLALLVFIYSTRYVGLAYVPIAMGVLLLSLLNSAAKAKAWSYALLALPIVVTLVTHNNIKEKYEAVYKVDTISPFGGWQLLNNISPMLPELRELDVAKIEGAKQQELHRFLMQFPDSVYTEAAMLVTAQMWNVPLPPKQYLFYQMQEQKLQYASAWVKVGVTFGEYAGQIVKLFPVKYFTRYIVPSLISTFNYYDLNDWKLPFKSEKYIETYFKVPADVQHEFNGSIFPLVNTLRRVGHYLFWILGSVSVALFAFNIKGYARGDSGRFFMLLMLIGFILAYIGASIIASPNTTWRYSMPFYVPALAFMAVTLGDAWRFLQEKITKKQPAHA